MGKLREMDLYRNYGKNKLSLREKLFMPPQLKYLRLLRKCQEKKGLVRIFYHIKLKKLSKVSHIQIPYQTKIDGGLHISHYGRIIVNRDAIIGKNVTLGTGVVVGQESRGARQGCPTIGNCVLLCPNSVVVGKVTIGEDVIIAPNAYVNFDVPAHSIVIGNPGKIIHKDEATKGYIGNLV